MIRWTGPKYFILNRMEDGVHIVFGVTLCSPGCAPDEVYRIAGEAFETVTQEFRSDKHLDAAVRGLREKYAAFKGAPVMLSPGLSDAAADELPEDPDLRHTARQNSSTHSLERFERGWRCTVCGADSEIRYNEGRCPGVPWYGYRDEIPAGVESRKQLDKRGLKPGGTGEDGVSPRLVGVYWSIKNAIEASWGREVMVPLYSVADAVPIEPEKLALREKRKAEHAARVQKRRADILASRPTFYFCFCNLDRHSEAVAETQELFAPGIDEEDVESMRDHAKKHRGYYSRLVITPITDERSPDGHLTYPIVVVGCATLLKLTQSSIQMISQRVTEALFKWGKITLRQSVLEPGKRFEADIANYTGEGERDPEWSTRHIKWLQEMILLALGDGERRTFAEVEAEVLKPSGGDGDPLHLFRVAVATLMARDKVVMIEEGEDSVYLQLTGKSRLP